MADSVPADVPAMDLEDYNYLLGYLELFYDGKIENWADDSGYQQVDGQWLTTHLSIPDAEPTTVDIWECLWWAAIGVEETD